MESDDHYGACLAAVAVSIAPEKYRETDAAKQGIAKLKDYLAKNPAPTLHHESMLLWASASGDGHHFISHAETAFAIMAIKSCEGKTAPVVGMK